MWYTLPSLLTNPTMGFVDYGPQCSVFIFQMPLVRLLFPYLSVWLTSFYAAKQSGSMYSDLFIDSNLQFYIFISRPCIFVMTIFFSIYGANISNDSMANVFKGNSSPKPSLRQYVLCTPASLNMAFGYIVRLKVAISTCIYPSQFERRRFTTQNLTHHSVSQTRHYKCLLFQDRGLGNANIFYAILISQDPCI